MKDPTLWQCTLFTAPGFSSKPGTKFVKQNRYIPRSFLAALIAVGPGHAPSGQNLALGGIFWYNIN